MRRAVFLDSGPLGLVTKRPGHSAEVDACQLWVESLASNNWHVYVPEIADYEVRRELLRGRNAAGVARLDRMITTARYLPITTDAMLLAAALWAKARNAGWPTSGPQALDGDVILAAQALTLGLPPSDVIVATTNIAHLSRYIAADSWENISP